MVCGHHFISWYIFEEKARSQKSPRDFVNTLQEIKEHGLCYSEYS